MKIQRKNNTKYIKKRFHFFLRRPLFVCNKYGDDNQVKYRRSNDYIHAVLTKLLLLFLSLFVEL